MRQSPFAGRTPPSPGIVSGPAGTFGSKSGEGLGEGLGDGLGEGLGEGLADGLGDVVASGVAARGVPRFGLTIVPAEGAGVAAWPGDATDDGDGPAEAAGDAGAVEAGGAAGAVDGFGAVEAGGALFGAAEGATDGAAAGVTGGALGLAVADGAAWVLTVGVTAVRVGSAFGASVVVGGAGSPSGAALALPNPGMSGLSSVTARVNATMKREKIIICHTLG